MVWDHTKVLESDKLYWLLVTSVIAVAYVIIHWEDRNMATWCRICRKQKGEGYPN
jgi:hypothetical protein